MFEHLSLGITKVFLIILIQQTVVKVERAIFLSDQGVPGLIYVSGLSVTK